jgi:hypothetical protein
LILLFFLKITTILGNTDVQLIYKMCRKIDFSILLYITIQTCTALAKLK